MAFKLVYHSDLHALAQQFIGDTQTRPTGVSPLESDYLVVQTPGMKRWLALETARQRGIWVGYEALNPVQLLMKLGFLLLRQREESTVFDKGNLSWALFQILSEVDSSHPGPLTGLVHVLGQKGAKHRQQRIFALADNLADLFDQYLLYRPDWLMAWETGGKISEAETTQPIDEFRATELWQSALWNELVKKQPGTPHRAAFFAQLEKALANPPRDAGFPLRVSMFGMSLLPATFLRLFSLLGNYCPVTLYLQVPSLAYWGDLRSWRAESAQEPAQGSRVLGTLGKTGREFFDLVLDQEYEEPDEVIDNLAEPPHPTNTSLLAQLKADIRSAQPPRHEPQTVDEKTWSMRFARCASPLREVEVLLDLLIETLANDSSLAPGDILVVTPDLATYGPLVDLVFSASEQSRGVRLDYDLADQNVLEENPFLQHVVELLDALRGRFEASTIVGLFEKSCELKGQTLEGQTVELLADWCADAGIRWGLSENTKADLGLPPDPSLTWQQGLDRLFAGFSVGGDEPLTDGLLPATVGNGETAALLGELAEFVFILGRLHEEAKCPRPLGEWVRLMVPELEALLGDSLVVEDEDGPWKVLQQCSSDLTESVKVTGVVASLDFDLFYEAVVGSLNVASSNNRFLSGRLAVAGMIPMRSLPFRVVALLGMNTGFPRDNTRPDYDLAAKRPRPGDRDQLNSDRYVFLETLLAAQDRLILIASGLTDDLSPAPESSLVEFLLGELDREYILGGQSAGKAITQIYPLQPSSPRYLSNKSADVALKTWDKAWFVPAPPPPAVVPFYRWRRPAPPIKPVIWATEIVKALSDPLASFISRGLGLVVDHSPPILEDTELFELDPLGEWKLRATLLEATRSPIKLDRFKASGGLPLGAAGELLIDEEMRTLDHRLEFLKSELQTEKLDWQELRAETQSGEQTAKFCQRGIVGPSGWVLVDLGKLKTKRRLAGWVAHLFANLEVERSTLLVTLDTHLKWKPMPSGRARQELEKLIELTYQTYQRPVAFFNRSSTKVADLTWNFFMESQKANFDASTRQTALDGAWKAIQTAIEGDEFGSKKPDSWLVRLFEVSEAWPALQAEFQDLAAQVFGPFKEFLSE